MLGTALVASGFACIALALIWYLVSRHRSRRAGLPGWTSGFGQGDRGINLNSERRTSGGIEIYNPSGQSAVEREALALRARQFAEARLANPVERPLSPPVAAERRLGNGQPAARETRTPASEPILVTGTSTPSGVAVVRALVSAGYEVVALDHDQFAPGFRLAQFGAVIPLASAPDFGITLAKVAEKTGARTLVPGEGAELESLSQALDVLGEAGVATWLPSRRLMAACADRHSLSATLASLAPIRLSEPPRAAGQTGRQFEADLLAGETGTLVAAIPRWRLATLGLETMAAETFERDDIASLLQALSSSIGLEGPATVSGFVDDDKSMITGVKLGFSSCVALNAAAGADIVVAYTKKLRGEGLPSALMPYRSGVRMVRHLDEVFET